MKTILTAKVWNPYKAMKPAGFYDKVKGHTGVDLDFVNEPIYAPCDLTVLKNLKQNEMGNVTYAQDINGYVHVFAHQKNFMTPVNVKVLKGEYFANSGNSGKKTRSPHLHYEILAPSGINPSMERKGLPYKGDNVNPLKYLQTMEEQNNIPDYAKSAWDKARKKGIFSEKTMPTENITPIKLAVFLERLGLL